MERSVFNLYSNNSNFSAALKRLKEANNVTIHQIAVAAQVTDGAIAKYLSGERTPSERTIKKLAEFFKVDPSELTGDSKNNVNTLLNRYHDALEQLNKIKTDVANAPVENMQEYINKLSEASKIVESTKEALRDVLLESKPVEYVPVYENRIPAGYPNSVGTEDISDWCAVPTEINADFAVNVTGDSMINAGIGDGDIVYATKNSTAEHGDVVIAATNDGEVTIKYFVKKGDKYFLMPANPDYKAIPFTDNFYIVGIVTAILKKPRPYKVAGEKDA
jgi:repressor LexA